MRLCSVSGLIGLLLLAASPWAWGAEITGYWLKETEDPHKSAIIEIYSSGSGFDGRVAKLRYPQFAPGEKAVTGEVVPPELVGKTKTDKMNPNPALRERPVQGLTLIEGFKPEGAGVWGGATIYNPEDGKTYTCKATLSRDGRTLKVRGYVGVPMLGRTQTWTRIDSLDALGWKEE